MWFHVELFAGGFGGWKQATRVMSLLSIPWHASRAVEIESELRNMYAASFDVKCRIAEDDQLLKTPGPIDPQKSWSWGNTPTARKAWQSINLTVVGNPKHFAAARCERCWGFACTLRDQLCDECDRFAFTPLDA